MEKQPGGPEEAVAYNSSAFKKARLQSILFALLDDPILSDVPKKPTLADVDTLINLEMGSAMKISILRMDGSTFEVAVLNSATVKDLKLAIAKKTNEMQQAQMGHRHISCCKICPSLYTTAPKQHRILRSRENGVTAGIFWAVGLLARSPRTSTTN